MSSYTTVRTDLGTLAIGFGEHGITRVVFPRGDWRDADHGELARAGLQRAETLPPAIARVADALQAHVAGKPQDFSGAPLDMLQSPPFHARVWRAARAIPPGQTLTYGALALRVGAPRAARAVGHAMATNPWPILVPCHRVFGQAGFGDYSAGSGVATKLRLLWREGYRGRTSNVAFDEHAAVTHLRSADPRLGKLIDRAGPFTLQATAPHPRGGIEPFAALARAIVGQQLSGKAAMTIYARVAALFGSDVIDDPAALAALPDTPLRSAGLSQNKARALRELARHAVAGTLPARAQMQAMADEEIIAALAGIRGIGRWSAQMLLMFYLGRPNVLPAGDLGVQKGFAIVYDRHGLPSAATVERAARAWAPFASVASWYLWRAVEMNGYRA